MPVPEWNCTFQYFLPKVMDNPEKCDCNEGGGHCITVDADRLETALQIRSRQPGDYLTMPYGHKKLKEFFIDKKIPAEERNYIPLVLSGEEIIWIPGYYVAECVRITGETERICRLACY